MPKKFISIATTAGTFLSLVSQTFAASGDYSPPPGFVNPNLEASAIPQLIINMLFGVATFLAVAYLMYGGIRWITSRGDKVGVESARKHIVAAVIGLVIVIGSFFILRVVFSILGVQNSFNFQLPTVSPAPPR
jgi:hypothetical protein